MTLDSDNWDSKKHQTPNYIFSATWSCCASLKFVPLWSLKAWSNEASFLKKRSSSIWKRLCMIIMEQSVHEQWTCLSREGKAVSRCLDSWSYDDWVKGYIKYQDNLILWVNCILFPQVKTDLKISKRPIPVTNVFMQLNNVPPYQH